MASLWGKTRYHSFSICRVKAFYFKATIFRFICVMQYLCCTVLAAIHLYFILNHNLLLDFLLMPCKRMTTSSTADKLFRQQHWYRSQTHSVHKYEYTIQDMYALCTNRLWLNKNAHKTALEVVLWTKKSFFDLNIYSLS